MNYKKIIKSRRLRCKILSLFDFIPDKMMIKFQYRVKMNRKLNLKNPQRYSEKIQWYKLYYRDSIMKKCVDKFEVRKYVEEKSCSELLNDVYGVFDSSDDIDFDELPNSFVIKDTLGGGGNSVIIVKDKSMLNIKETREKMKSWLSNVSKKNPGREWVYDNQKHRIIIEKYINSQNRMGLIDYKFFCFSGKVKYVYAITNRTLGKSAKLGIFDYEFNLLPYYRVGKEKLANHIEKPKNYKQMVEYAELLSSDFPHARIDFYNVDGKIIFGEITFFNASGYSQFDPDEFDIELGKQFILPKKNN